VSRDQKGILRQINKKSEWANLIFCDDERNELFQPTCQYSAFISFYYREKQKVAPRFCHLVPFGSSFEESFNVIKWITIPLRMIPGQKRDCLCVVEYYTTRRTSRNPIIPMGVGNFLIQQYSSSKVDLLLLLKEQKYISFCLKKVDTITLQSTHA
jgi:hypothetical protein